MTKGGLLKDDTDLSKLGVHAGQQFMVLGAAGELPQAPVQPVVQFAEDLPPAQARSDDERVGLLNLGNTCYLNSTLQVLRTIPELQESLNAATSLSASSGNGDVALSAALRDLFKSMQSSTNAFAPLLFLSVLRRVAPQFAETAEGGGFAQQDAEEVWVRIVNALNTLPVAGAASERFVPQFLTGQMSVERSCAEAPDEAHSSATDPFLILQCNISSTTNDMSRGILDSLTQQIEKHSEQLQRTAVYDEKSRVARLPRYLAVHFVRFYWRRDIHKKTKIMRKVKFPLELDAGEFATDELRARLGPVAARVKAVAKERDERAKVRRRVKTQADADSNAPAAGSALTDDQEREARAREAHEIDALVDAGLRSDLGANVSGLYELAGIVTHKGAAADAGHYISWVRRDAKREALDTPDDAWLKLDDDRVSVVSPDKIDSLSGGGQDSVAYILLYRAKTW